MTKKTGRPAGTAYGGGRLSTQLTRRQRERRDRIYDEWEQVFGQRPIDSQVLRDGFDRELSEMARTLRKESEK